MVYRISLAVLCISIGMICLLLVRSFPEPGQEQALSEQISPDRYLTKKARAAYFQRMLRDPQTGEIPKNIRKRELAYAATLPNRRTAPDKSAGSVNISWLEAGPNDVGGRTRALAVDRMDSNTILAGGVAGGIWKSTDRGDSWELKSDPSQLTSVTYISQDPRPGQNTTWYAVTGEFTGSNSDRGRRAPLYGEGLYTSTDNGESWTQIASAEDPTLLDSPFDIGLKVLVSPTTGSLFTASQAFGIQRLQSPTAVPEGVLGTESFPEWSDFDIATDGSIIAVTSRGVTPSPTDPPGVFYSTDNGDTWQDITPSAFPEMPERSVIAFAPSSPNTAYLWTFTGVTNPSTNSFGEEEVSQFYVFTLPSGTSEDRSANLPQFGGDVGDLYTQNNYDMVIAVNPNDANDVFIGGTNLYRSRDGFATAILSKDIAKTWVGGYAIVNNASQYQDHHPDQHALFFDPQEVDVLWSGHDGGLSMAADINATTTLIDWENKNNGYNVTQFYHVSIPPAAGDDRVLGGTQDNGTPFIRFASASQGGSPSMQVTGGDGGYSYLGGSYGISSSQEGKLFELNYSRTGLVLFAGSFTPPQASNQLFITPFAVDQLDESVVYYPGGNELWRGRGIPLAPDWSQVAAATVPSGYVISALDAGVRTINQLPTPVLYFGASGSGLAPALYRLDDAISSTEAPENISILTLPSNAYIHHIAVNPMDGNELLVLASNYNIIGLYHSSNGGDTFTAVEGNLAGTDELPGPSLRSATLLPVNGTTLYVLGTSTGVYSTTFLNGESTVWTQEAASELGNTVVESITSRVSDQRIAVGTHGRGIFIGAPLPTVSTEELPEPRGTNLGRLAQNYPNPFRATTSIDYTIEQPGIVSLHVFDATGRRIKTLIRQQSQPPGSYSFLLDSGTLAGGMYIYELEVRPLLASGNVLRESKAMVLQK